ncbi:L-histidine N(alpha)-methyltransferase [Streptomyces sp. NPDC001843]|uniref:L-histidine N(alpha)-methyltransferase n=1 Tax=Streptomyces sp. NPDC001843 TaxID=3364617 RepID=UPI00368B6622
MPVRFLYMGSAAERHVRLAEEHPDEYLDGRSECEVDAVCAVFGGAAQAPRQMCDIGTSNGVHSAQLVAGLRRRGFALERYLGLDLSPRLLDAARARMSPHLPGDSDFTCWDIENAPTGRIASWREPGGDALLLCLLGGTLGNMEDPVQTLRHIRASCTERDVLMLGVFLPPSPGENVVGPYATPEMRDIMLIPLRAVGLTDDQLELRVEFVDDAVTGTARLRHGTQVGDIWLAEGDEVRCFLSRRFTLDGIGRILGSSGWLTSAERIGVGGTYAVFFARPA